VDDNSQIQQWSYKPHSNSPHISFASHFALSQLVIQLHDISRASPNISRWAEQIANQGSDKWMMTFLEDGDAKGDLSGCH
jgi:hypothetical protein